MTLQRIESWLPAPGWEESYEVSHRGQIRSIDRWVMDISGMRRRFFRGRIRKLRPDGGGHLGAMLSRPGSKPQFVKVHFLVLTAYAGPPKPGQVARHGPGGNQDNRWPENLCWGTRAENMADKLRDGTHNRGERHPQAKLTEAIVRECRRRNATGESISVMAREYRVSVSTMRFAVRGIQWRHLA